MKQSTIFVLFMLCFFGGFTQQNIPVFKLETDGYKSYRIPAIIALPNGDLLSFCEGRKHGAGDFGDIDIVMKRSKNKGKTWSTLQVVVDADSLQTGNAAPVVDLTDPAYPKGRIFLFYNTGNNNETEVRKGKGLREVWYKTSTDNGITWSKPVNITAQVHRPNQPEVKAAYHFSEDWRSNANTPGHAMQLEWGKYKGRIFVAANHSSGDPKRDFTDYAAHGFYTNDHGRTFHLAATVPIAGSNESTAAELWGNGLMMNSRNQRGDVKARIVSISKDGGATWDTSYIDANLPDPVNEGSLLSIGKKGRKNILAFCNAADTLRRDNLTLRISEDDGKTWKKSFVIDKSSDDEDDNSAYSDIVKLSQNKIGILYEKDGYKEIVFTAIQWK